MSIAPKHNDALASLPRRASHERWTYASVSLALRAAESLVVAMGAAAAMAIRFDGLGFGNDYGILTALGVVCFALVSHANGAYHLSRLKSRFGEVTRVLGAWSFALAAVLLLCFATKTTADFSRIWFGAWWLIGLAGLLMTRLVAMQLVRAAERRGQLTEQVVVVGDRRSLARTLDLLSRFDIRILATLPLAGPPGDPQQGLAAAAAAAREACSSMAVDRVLLAPNLGEESQLARYVEEFQFLPVETAMLPPDQTLERALNAGTNRQIPVLEVVARRPLSDADHALKRGFDLAAGLLLLIAFSPLLLLLALAVKLSSPGPVFFRQQRAGYGGSSFIVWKFRTMHVGPGRGDDVRQARRNDPRVTGLGRVLRRTSLDELPQLLNVVLGEMSLVGPRPHAVAHDIAFAQQVNSYLARHRVKPGMTGLAQVKGFRGEIASPEALKQRISNDLWYAENWSLLLDLRILLMTALVLAGRNAY